MKKFVTFLMVGCCLIMCSNDLFSSVKFFPNSSLSDDHHFENLSNEFLTDCGTVSGFAFFANDGSSTENGQGCIDVVAQDFTNILLFQWTMEFSSSVGTFSHVRGVNLPDSVYATQPSGPDLITISWQSANFSGINVPPCEVLFQVCFDAAGQDGDQMDVLFTSSQTNKEVRDEVGTLLDPDYYTGTFSINGTGGGNPNPPTTGGSGCGSINGISFYAEDVSVAANGQTCVGVTAQDFENVMSFQWSMAYDSTLIELDTAYATGLPANSFRWGRNINSNNIGTPGPGILGSGFQYPAGTNKVITVSWLEPNFSGVTIADCDELFKLCFDAIGPDGQTSPVIFSDSPTGVEIGDPDFNVLLNNINSFADGTVAIGSGGGPINPPTTTTDCGSISGLSFYGSTVCTAPNQNSCVEVSAASFNNVMSFQWSMAYDSTIIELDTAYAVDLPANSFRWGRNINSNNIGTPGPGILGSGFQYPTGTNKAITISWLEPNFAGVTLDDCDVLFNLCFDAVGNAGQISPVVFSDSPTAVEVGDPDFNVLLNDVNSFSNSTFEISSDCGGTTPPVPPTPPTDDCGTINGLSFYASDNCTDPSEDICVEIKAADFTNVMSFQWSMAYDSTIIELDTAYSVDLPANSFRWGRNINSNNIGTPGPGFLPSGFQYPTGTNKVITISWLEPNFAGITLDDCEVLFNLCFTPVGNDGQISPVVFMASPTNVEIGDPDFNVLLDNITPFSEGQVELNTNCAGTLPPVDPVPTPSNVNITNVNCRGDNSGSIILGYNQSTAGLSFNWSPGGATTKDLGSLSAGTYNVTITEGTQDTVLTYTVTQPTSSLSANSSNVNQITCKGLDNGSISVVANGGSGVHSYSWGGSLSGNTPTQNNLAPGAYNVTVSDANGCTQTVGPIAITEPQLVQVSGTVTDVDCSGRSNGRINLSATGGTTGTSGYSYSWNPSASNQNLTNIPAGNYSVTVEDANGCQTTDSYVVNAPAPIVITSNSITGEANGNDGAIDINVNGGILNGTLPNYIYTWSQSANSQITQDASNLAAGTHTVQVRDAVGCSASATFTVDFVGPAFNLNSVDVSPSCPDVCNGSINVQVTGGINPQITWTAIPAVPGLSGFSLTNLCVGNYSYIVTDNGVIVAQGSEFIGPRLPLVITGNPMDEVNGNDGSIQLNAVQNSVGTLTYTWTNVASGTVIGSGSSITGLQAGTYEVLVTDNGSGCSNTARFVIEDKRPVEIDGLNVTNSQCAGDNGGTIEFTVTQGLPDFTIEITGGPLGQPITEVRTTSPPFSYNTGGLPEGNYMVRVTDGNQSIFSDNFTISEPSQMSASALIYPHTSTQNGRIDLTVTGGTTPYDIDWGSGNNPSNLQPGTYRATVTDGNGCEFITSDYSVTRFRIIEFNKIDANCTDAANGSLSIAVDGGNLPYQYRWTDSGGNQIGTDAMISGLAPGTYSVVVTGNLGTEITETYTITEQSTISTSTVITTNYSGFNVSCFDGTDGQARVTAANGISPYTYKWEDGQDTEQAFNLSAGTILVTVTDAVGCSSSSSATLTQPPVVDVEQDVRGVDCFGDTNGEIRVFTSGGVRYPGVERYIYQWDEITFDGSTVRNVSAGDYELLIEDANGCQENVVVTVPGPTRELYAEVITTDSDGDCNGSARAEVVGGTAPYFYRWINRFTADSTDRELLGLCSDEYTLVVTDANGCETSAVGRVGNTAIECLSTRAVITPDGGGLNEEFIIWCIEQYPDNTLEIYNRWGQLVWEQDDYDNTWRGKTMRQGDVPDGAYFYVFRYVLNGETLQTKGSFTLLRD